MDLDVVLQYVFKIVNPVIAWTIFFMNIRMYACKRMSFRRVNDTTIYLSFACSALFYGIVSTYTLYRLFTYGPTMMGTLMDDMNRSAVFMLLMSILIRTVSRGKSWVTR